MDALSPATRAARRPPGPAARTPQPVRAKRRRTRIRILLFLSPWILGFTVFLAYPLIMTVWLSFTNSDIDRKSVV